MTIEKKITKVVIVGAGSVGKFLANNANQFTEAYEFIGFLDDDSNKQNQIIAGIPVLGTTEKLPELVQQNTAIAWGIAFPKIKAQLVEKHKHLEAVFPSFISKAAWISNEVKIGKGCIIYPGCSINYETQIGDFVVMNMNCALGHNVSLGDFTSLAPGVNLGGYTKIGDQTDMGIGAATKQFIEIGKGCVVGGQAMVTKPFSSNLTIIGVPAIELKI
jgi:sugar O-acyltransferase (sialic acid O-acetyltransferase NeuD family)